MSTCTHCELTTDLHCLANGFSVLHREGTAWQQGLRVPGRGGGQLNDEVL